MLLRLCCVSVAYPRHRDKERLQLQRTFLSRYLQRFLAVLDAVPADGPVDPYILRQGRHNERDGIFEDGG